MCACTRCPRTFTFIAPLLIMLLCVSHFRNYYFDKDALLNVTLLQSNFINYEAYVVICCPKRPVSSVVKRTLSVLQVWGLVAGPVKSDIVSLMARHRCDFSSELHCPGAKPWRRAPPLVTRFGVISRV